MKKIRLIFLVFLTSLILKNSNALINKKSIHDLIFLNNLFIITDQIFPTEYKIWAEAQINFTKPQVIQFNHPKDKSFSFYIPSLSNKMLHSAIQERESLLSAILNGYIRATKFEEYIKNKINQQKNLFNNIKRKEYTVILTEIIIEKLINEIVNKIINDDGIFKRIFKIMLFSAVGTGGGYLRQYIFDNEIKEHLPHLTSITIDKLIENSIVEIGALLINYLVDDPVKQQKKEFHKKLQQILENINLKQIDNIDNVVTDHIQKNKNKPSLKTTVHK
ncbi:hypothetical protein KAT08_04585 [Candidatus Babeliales bacterium]|nr:hypothetical protein [Candidatus Babeliales bacterium]